LKLTFVSQKCPNIQCGKYWDRDVCGSKNIEAILTSIIQNNPRPAHLFKSFELENDHNHAQFGSARGKSRGNDKLRVRLDAFVDENKQVQFKRHIEQTPVFLEDPLEISMMTRWKINQSFIHVPSMQRNQCLPLVAMRPDWWSKKLKRTTAQRRQEKLNRESFRNLTTLSFARKRSANDEPRLVKRQKKGVQNLEFIPTSSRESSDLQESIENFQIEFAAGSLQESCSDSCDQAHQHNQN
jgi:hypothetical protein